MKRLKHLSAPFQAGVIDVGAHSVRLDLFEVAGTGKTTLLESLSRSVNLGFDVFRHGSVSPENLSRLSSILTDFSRKLAEYRVAIYRVVATSAIREAFNRELVINRIRNDAHLDLEILETQEEIRISFLSMREALSRQVPFSGKRGICLMVGAGSLLVCYFDGGLMRFCEEVALGTVRLFDAFGHSAVSMEQVIESLSSQDIRQRLVECVGLRHDEPIALVAMGASARVFSGALSGLPHEGADEEAIILEPARVADAARIWMQRDPAALASEYRIGEESAASAAVCGGILSYFFESFTCSEFICPAITTRSALIDELVRRNFSSGGDPFHRDLLAVCDAVGHKYGYDPVHAAQVAEIAVKFFEKLKRSFDFSSRALVLLEVAARLHDIGRFVDTRQHHKHSYYLISNMELPGITNEEQRVIAAICRYHRKTCPQDSHLEYVSLSAENKVTVLKLAAILRVADSLDSVRDRRFRRMKLVLRGHVLTIQVPEAGELRTERFYLELKGDLFNQVFGLELKIEEAPGL